MLVFSQMLVRPAKMAGIRVPDDVDHYDKSQYPYWHVYCRMQLGSPMPHMACHWDNAHIVAKVSEEKIKTITYGELIDLGFAIGYSK